MSNLKKKNVPSVDKSVSINSSLILPSWRLLLQSSSLPFPLLSTPLDRGNETQEGLSHLVPEKRPSECDDGA